MFDINLIVLMIFALLFVGNAFRQQKFNWLWFAVAVWLVLGLWSASILPSVLGITHLTNFYLLHGYIFTGSIFFFLNDLEKLPKRTATWQGARAGNYLSLLATAGLAMHVAFILLMLLVWWLYPAGQSAMLPARLMTLYVLQPVYWWSMQAFLMLLFALHRKMVGDAIHVFSLQQVQMGVFLALVWQFLYVVDAHRWLPNLIYDYFQAA